jgi:hypothetical protein
MWMIAVCCMRRASICDARDNPLRDFVPTAPAHGPCTWSRGTKCSARIRGAKGEGSAPGGRVQDFHAVLPPSTRCSQRVAWSAPPVRSDSGAWLRIPRLLRNHAVIPGLTTTRKSPCRNCFLADCGPESGSLRM